MALMPSLCWPEVLEISGEQVIAAARQFGVRDAADLESEEGEQMRRQLHLVGMMSPGDPPIYVHNNQRGGPPQGVAQMAHHPNHARVLKQRAEQLGVVAVVNAPQIGIVDDSGETLVSFLLRHLQVEAND